MKWLENLSRRYAESRDVKISKFLNFKFTGTLAYHKGGGALDSRGVGYPTQESLNNDCCRGPIDRRLDPKSQGSSTRVCRRNLLALLILGEEDVVAREEACEYGEGE